MTQDELVAAARRKTAAQRTPEEAEALRAYNREAKRDHDARKYVARAEERRTTERAQESLSEEAEGVRGAAAKRYRIWMAIDLLANPPRLEEHWLAEHIEFCVGELELLAQTPTAQLNFDFRAAYWNLLDLAAGAAKSKGLSLLDIKVPELPEADGWLRSTRIGDKVGGVYSGYVALQQEIKNRNSGEIKCRQNH